METVTLNLPLPGMIDGDTDEVEEILLSVIARSMDEFAEWIDEASKQLANSERSRILENGSGITAVQLTSRYLESKRAATLARLNGAAKALCSAAAEL